MEHRTVLMYYERIELAMRSNVELVLAYGILFWAVSELFGGYAVPITGGGKAQARHDIRAVLQRRDDYHHRLR